MICSKCPCLKNCVKQFLPLHRKVKACLVFSFTILSDGEIVAIVCPKVVAELKPLLNLHNN